MYKIILLSTYKKAVDELLILFELGSAGVTVKHWLMNSYGTYLDIFDTVANILD